MNNLPKNNIEIHKPKDPEFFSRVGIEIEKFVIWEDYRTKNNVSKEIINDAHRKYLYALNKAINFQLSNNATYSSLKEIYSLVGGGSFLDSINYIDDETIELYLRKDISINMEYLINTIENNKIDNFYGIEEKSKLLIFNSNFEQIQNDIKSYYSFIKENGTQEPKYLEEIIFLSKYIDLLFKEAKKENGNLLSIFKNEEDKNRFYQLLPEYFGKNFNNKIMEIRQHTPGFTKEDDEKFAQEEEQKKIQEEIKNGTLHILEDGSMSRLSQDEINSLLSIFNEE